MDITKLFRACVKTAEMRQGKQQKSQNKASVESIPSEQTKTQISFTKKCSDVTKSISKLKDFLMKHNKDYISEFSHISLEASSFTEEDRNQIDEDAQLFITACSTKIHLLKKEAERINEESQLSSHSTSVVSLLESYLKSVCGYYSQQKAIRVKQAVERKRMSRLSSRRMNSKTELPNSDPLKSSETELRHRTTSTSKTIVKDQESVSTKKSAAYVSLQPDNTIIEELPTEKKQLLEMENKQLYEDMNHLVDEVRMIEGKVIEISQLQDIFSENVLHQAEQVETIHDVAIATTENVKDGNENIREAIKNSASFRAYLLFILVMCTLSLLLLDWYSR